MKRFMTVLFLLLLSSPAAWPQSSQNFKIEADFFDSGGLGVSNPRSTNFFNTTSAGQSASGQSSQSQNFQATSGAGGAFFAPTTPTGVTDLSSLPTVYTLEQNYPNPFNPTTIISYALPKQSHVTLKVYDVLGRDLQTLVEEKQDVGVYTLKFDASGLASGVYFYRLVAGSFISTKKLMLLR
jgi:hypothetical protein